jgi:hypothetical protein
VVVVRRANPDLPILDELGARFEALVDAEFDATETGSRPRARLPEPSRAVAQRSRNRIARRVAVVLGLLCLVGGVALAARFGGPGADRPADTSPAMIGDGGEGAWRLSAYRDQGRLCVLFEVADEPVSQCGPMPPAKGLREMSALGAGRRFVVGVTGQRVTSVRAGVGTTTGSALTRPPEDRSAARRAALPATLRWFVIPLGGSAGQSRAPARVFAFDGHGARLGRPGVDCSLGVIGSACEREIRLRAERASR